MVTPVRFLLRASLIFAIAGGSPSQFVAAAEKPKLSLKGSPSLGTSSTVFVFQAVLTGGEDNEDLYCLSTEWIWEEQADSSLNETECAPYEAGETRIDRSFTEEQSFKRPGTHFVKVILRKGEKVIASAGTTVKVRPDR